jgi:hypothetical protein
VVGSCHWTRCAVASCRCTSLSCGATGEVASMRTRGRGDGRCRRTRGRSAVRYLRRRERGWTDGSAGAGTVVRVSSLARRWRRRYHAARRLAATTPCLRGWGRPVILRRSRREADRRYESVIDYEREPTSAWEEFVGAPGAFRDSAGARVSVVSEAATIGDWDSAPVPVQRAARRRRRRSFERAPVRHGRCCGRPRDAHRARRDDDAAAAGLA